MGALCCLQNEVRPRSFPVGCFPLLFSTVCVPRSTSWSDFVLVMLYRQINQTNMTNGDTGVSRISFFCTDFGWCAREPLPFSRVRACVPLLFLISLLLCYIAKYTDQIRTTRGTWIGQRTRYRSSRYAGTREQGKRGGTTGGASHPRCHHHLHAAHSLCTHYTLSAQSLHNQK